MKFDLALQRPSRSHFDYEFEETILPLNDPYNWKLKTALLSLKSRIPAIFQSNILYEIKSPLPIIPATSVKQPDTLRLASLNMEGALVILECMCTSAARLLPTCEVKTIDKLNDIVVVDDIKKLLTMEALHVDKIRAVINTNEDRARELTFRV